MQGRGADEEDFSFGRLYAGQGEPVLVELDQRAQAIIGVGKSFSDCGQESEDSFFIVFEDSFL